jgi:excinuclease ABC subunit A
MSLKTISIRGAREHNLKDINVDIPRDSLTVITGLSGSGKSSLAFDTIYAEGQRRYVESLSAYARQFLEMMQKPDVDSIEGLSPAISIEQKTTSKNPRSTVGTVTEIYDYMRLLWARIGVPYSPATGKPISSQTVSEIVDRIMGMANLNCHSGESRNRVNTKQPDPVLQRNDTEGQRDDTEGKRDNAPSTVIPSAVEGSETRPDSSASLRSGRNDSLRLYILAPIIRGRKGEYAKLFKDLQAKGFQRVKVDGEIYEIDDVPKLDKKLKHDIEVVVDRLVVRDDITSRLADSIETALTLADGLMIAEDADTGAQHLFSEKFACPVSGFTIPEIEPRLFSFNSPHGACETCDGLGVRQYMDPELVVPDDRKSITDGAIAAWGGAFKGYYIQSMQATADHFGFAINIPWADMAEEHKNIILYGSGTTRIKTQYKSKNKSTWNSNKPFEGVIPNLERRLVETDSNSQREKINKFMSSAPCEACESKRLNDKALAVKINGKTIADISALSIEDAAVWFDCLQQSDVIASEAKQSISTKTKDGLPRRPDGLLAMTPQNATIAAPILKEISERLTFLRNVGLDYLNLSRKSGTLSGGESQRIRLASQIGSGLTGVLYVLDEPSIGLHQRDNNRLLETLKRLRDLGNTVLVVEHDEDAIRTADHIIDMGPKAGTHGGEIVAQGTLDDVLKSQTSITAAYLRGDKDVAVPEMRRYTTMSSRPKQREVEGSDRKKDPSTALGMTAQEKTITIIGARGHNLKNVTASIPLGTFTCITGVSGSGKSSLTIDTLYKAATKTLNKSKLTPLPHDEIKGLEFIDKIIDIDQSPIGRTPRSNPATYTGAFSPIRDWYAGLPEAKMRGYKPGRFSFNVKGGRCEACRGDGLIKIEMHFLPDVYVQCDSCKGKRYNRETLDVKFKSKSIADVLDMTVDEAAAFFKAVPSIHKKLETLQKVGLGYIHVGQQATTLSGGEAQRVKLSKELAKRSTGKTLYILDEPTTGLHFEDVRKLLEVLHTLVDQGNTVVVIEHNLDVIKTADYIIDIGPEGGDNGGQIVATGTPEDVVKVKESYTGQFLRPLLEMCKKVA